jgi:hypothetical protein
MDGNDGGGGWMVGTGGLDGVEWMRWMDGWATLHVVCHPQPPFTHPTPPHPTTNHATITTTINPPPPTHTQDRRGPANEDAEKALSMPRYGLQRIITRLFPEPRVKPKAVLEREAEELREERKRRRDEVRWGGGVWGDCGGL